jgi:protein-disulfide isomerase/uncharacterized membrane protein
MPNNERLVLRWRIAFLVLATVGICLSADLLRLHVKVHTDPQYHSYCAINEWANCETVAASDYAVLFGLPVALWGLLGYLAMGALSVWGLRRPLSPVSWPLGLLFWLSAFSTLGSTVLFCISHFIIESICVVCMGTYVTNALLLVTSFIELRRLELGPVESLVSELRSVRTRCLPLALFTGSFVVVILLLWVTVPAYWRIDLTTGPEGLSVGVTSSGYPWIGAVEPKVTIEEYSDYQCPYCQRGHEEMRKLIKAHSKTIRLVHRYYPLDQACNKLLDRPFHPFACSYARMAFCAQKQNRFWEANDFLFEKGRRKEEVSTAELASAIKIDSSRLAQCVKSQAAVTAIEKDLQSGQTLRIRGTPTFVIGERVYPGRIPDEVLGPFINPPNKP